MKRGKLENFLQKYGTALFLAYMLLAVVPLFVYNTEFNAPFKFAFIFLGAPILVCSFLVYLHWMPEFRSKSGKLRGFMLTLLMAVLLTLMSGGYVSAFNALGPWQREVIVAGEVVDLSISSGRSSTSYLVTIRSAQGDQTKLEVSAEEYAQLSTGQYYSRPWKVGSLGILYK